MEDGDRKWVKKVRVLHAAENIKKIEEPIYHKPADDDKEWEKYNFDRTKQLGDMPE